MGRGFRPRPGSIWQVARLWSGRATHPGPELARPAALKLHGQDRPMVPRHESDLTVLSGIPARVAWQCFLQEGRFRPHGRVGVAPAVAS